MKRILLALLVLALAGCSQPQKAPSAQSEPQSEGACRITITNPSKAAHTISVVTIEGKMIVKGSVPALNNTRPSVWKMVNADISGKDIVITIDKKETKVSVGSNTAEIVINVASHDQIVTQHSKKRTWI